MAEGSDKLASRKLRRSRTDCHIKCHVADMNSWFHTATLAKAKNTNWKSRTPESTNYIRLPPTTPGPNTRLRNRDSTRLPEMGDLEESSKDSDAVANANQDKSQQSSATIADPPMDTASFQRAMLQLMTEGFI